MFHRGEYERELLHFEMERAKRLMLEDITKNDVIIDINDGSDTAETIIDNHMSKLYHQVQNIYTPKENPFVACFRKCFGL